MWPLGLLLSEEHLIVLNNSMDIEDVHVPRISSLIFEKITGC
jgi:hypothetical protein